MEVPEKGQDVDFLLIIARIRAMDDSRVAPVSRGSTAYPRKRAVTACQVCRARRTKCDQKKPRCSFCERTGAECISEPAALSTFDPASIAILQQLDTLEKKLDSLVRSPPTLPVNEFNDFPANNTDIPENLLPENLDKVLKWPVFRDVVCPMPPSPQLSSPPASSLTSFQPSFISGELNPAMCNQCLDTFFSHVHVKNPVLDEPNIRRLVRNVCLEGVGWDADSCLALLVCANGAIARPFSSPSLSKEDLGASIGKALFIAAQKRMGSILESAGIIQAQCLFLAGVYMMTSLRPFDAWRLFLQGLAICQSFTFIRRRPTSATTGDGGNPAEESIYWSCWKSERELRWELGLPDFGHPSLDPPQLFPSLPLGHADETLRAWYFYLSEISLWRLETEARTEITRCVSERRSSGPLLELLAEVSDSNHQQLVKWQSSLPSIVSISDPGSSDAETDILKFVLRGRTTYIYELISWPFIYSAIIGGQEGMSSKAREWATEGLQFHVDRLTINRPGFYHRHHGTWLMIRSSARSACILLAVARTISVRDLLPSGWREAIEGTIEMLYFWRLEVDGIQETANFLRYILSEFT